MNMGNALAPLTELAAWQALEKHYPKIRKLHLRKLFADDPKRGERMAVEAVGIYFDYSKHLITGETLKLLLQLAEESGLRARRFHVHALFAMGFGSSDYEPVSQRLLPLDVQWQKGLAKVGWPTGTLPEVMGSGSTTLRSLIRGYLFISLFRACAESLASENASRLAAMERADKNIDELLESLNGSFHRLRQSGIDEELFDVISGFEALVGP
jgi:alternate F1F0 ATPase F1 subunit gamma